MTVALGDVEDDAVPVSDVELVAMGEWDTPRVADDVALGVGGIVPDCKVDCDPVAEALGEPSCEIDCVADGEAVCDDVKVTLGLASCDSVMVRVRPPETVCDGVVLAVTDCEGVSALEGDCVSLRLCVSLEESEPEGVAVALVENACDRDWVTLVDDAWLDDAVPLRVAPCDADGVAVCEPVCDEELVEAPLGLCVPLPVGA